MQTLGIFQQVGTVEWIVLLALGLLIFGRRLPEVGRSLGRGIVEFRKGLKGIDDEVETASSARSGPSQRPLPADTGMGGAPVTAPPVDVRVSRSDAVE